MDKLKKILLNDRGISLIEIIVAMTVFSLALIPILGDMSGISNIIFNNESNISANNLILQAAEQVRATHFVSVNTAADVTNYQGSGLVLKQTVIQPAGTSANVKQVTLSLMDGAREVQRMVLVIYKGM